MHNIIKDFKKKKKNTFQDFRGSVETRLFHFVLHLTPYATLHLAHRQQSILITYLMHNLSLTTRGPSMHELILYQLMFAVKSLKETRHFSHIHSSDATLEGYILAHM